MCSVNIRLHSISEVTEFVRKINSVQGDVVAKVGKLEITVKSLMSMFTLDLMSDIQIVYYGDDSDSFMRLAEVYSVGGDLNNAKG